MTLDVAIAHYSRTGATDAIASAIAGHFDDPTRIRIRPLTERSYPNWLARSFLPGSTVPIEPVETDLRAYDLAFLGSPKWTLSCPPVTRYIRDIEIADTPVGVFLTYGGFDEERYLDNVVSTLVEKDARVKGTLSVKRSTIEAEAYEQGVEHFCEGIVETLDR